MSAWLDEIAPDAFHARVHWARRNGHADWLWPDLPVADWRRAMAAIVAVTRRVLTGKAPCALATEHPYALSVACYTSGMGPLLGWWLEEGRLQTSPAAADVLVVHLAHSRTRNRALSRIAQDLGDKLKALGVGAALLKGMHTAHAYFPDPGARPFSDIDICLAPSDVPRMESLLSGLGYVSTVRMRNPYRCDWQPPASRREPRTLAYVHRDDPWSFDVQASLDRRHLTGRIVPLDKLFAEYRTEAWPSSPTLRVLSQPLLLLQLAAHASEVLHNLTLVRLCEIVFVIRRDCLSGALDWSAFLSGAAAIGGARFVFPALQACERLAPGTVPQAVLATCARDAPPRLRRLLADLPLAEMQPLGRHSLRERLVWVADWRDLVGQLACELSLDGQGRSLRQALYNIGTKLLAVGRLRLTA